MNLCGAFFRLHQLPPPEWIIIFIFAIGFGNFLDTKLTKNRIWKQIFPPKKTEPFRNGSKKNSFYFFFQFIGFNGGFTTQSIHNISWQTYRNVVHDLFLFCQLCTAIARFVTCHILSIGMHSFTILSPIIISKWLGKCIKHKNGVKAKRMANTQSEL